MYYGFSQIEKANIVIGQSQKLKVGLSMARWFSNLQPSGFVNAEGATQGIKLKGSPVEVHFQFPSSSYINQSQEINDYCKKKNERYRCCLS